MDLINWSLNAIDTIFSTRSLGSGEPVCPDGTFAAGYTMDAWERWRIVCLAALSVEDIEDIYLFGTMITGILLIGLGFALGYRRIKKTGTAVQSLTRLPVMIEAVGRVVSRKRVAMELECGYSPQDKTINLIFFGSPAQWPRPRLLLENNPGKSTAVRRSCFLPHSTDIDYKLLHKHTYALTSPPLIPRLRRFEPPA